MIYGERVRQLREMHKLTQADLAAEIPTLTQPQLSRVESSLAELDDESAALIAMRAGVTVDFLQTPPSPEISAHSPQLRSRSRLTQRDKAASLQWARLVDEQYELLQSTVLRIPNRLRPLHSQPPQEAAQTVRHLLNFSESEPLSSLVLAVERAGVRILGLPFSSSEMDAFSAWREGQPIIGLLADIPGDRIRFSVAHELGHLVLHRANQTGKAIESEADEFAAELLMPTDRAREVIPRHVTLGNLTMLKTQWGVSIKSLVVRARQIGIIDQDRAISLYKQISSRGWNRAEPGHVPIEKPRAFRKLAEIVHGDGPNVPKMAAEAYWSEDLAFRVLDQHASAAELPYETFSAAPDVQHDNVVHLSSRARQKWAVQNIASGPENCY